MDGSLCSRTTKSMRGGTKSENCIYVAEEKQEKKMNLDQMIANAKISGGKCRHELNRRRR